MKKEKKPRKDDVSQGATFRRACSINTWTETIHGGRPTRRKNVM